MGCLVSTTHTLTPAGQGLCPVLVFAYPGPSTCSRVLCVQQSLAFLKTLFSIARLACQSSTSYALFPIIFFLLTFRVTTVSPFYHLAKKFVKPHASVFCRFWNSEDPLGTFHSWRREKLMAPRRQEKEEKLQVQGSVHEPPNPSGQGIPSQVRINMGRRQDSPCADFVKALREKGPLGKKPQVSKSGERLGIIRLMDTTPSIGCHFICFFNSQ